MSSGFDALSKHDLPNVGPIHINVGEGMISGKFDFRAIWDGQVTQALRRLADSLEILGAEGGIPHFVSLDEGKMFTS